MSISLRTHKHRAATGMTRRIDKATSLALRYGPACHPFRVRCQWSFTQQTAWNPHPPRIFQNDRAMVDYTRSVPRGREADR